MKKDRVEEGIKFLKEIQVPKNLRSNILMEVKEKSQSVRLIQLQLATVMSVVLFFVSGVGYVMSVPTEDNPLSVLDGVASVSVLSDMALESLI